MFDAKCTIEDNCRAYSIVDFQQLYDNEIARLRQYLECPKCGGKAFYRKKSVDGKAACFGSRYHTCEDANPTPQRQTEIQNAREVEKIIASSEMINITFSSRSAVVKEKQTAIVGSATVRCDAKGKNVHTQQANTTRTPSIGLKKILDSLMAGSSLADSESIISIDGYHFKAKNLFVNFSDSSPAINLNSAKPKMYWGTLSHSDDPISWLNPADCNDVGISLGGYRDKIVQCFRINDKRRLEGAGIILFGYCFWNAKKNRKIIKLWNDERVYISLLED